MFIYHLILVLKKIPSPCELVVLPVYSQGSQLPMAVSRKIWNYDLNPEDTWLKFHVLFVRS